MAALEAGSDGTAVQASPPRFPLLLKAFFLLVDRPEVYNLPPDPVVPTMKGREAWTSMGWGALGMAVVALGAVLFVPVSAS